MNLRSDTVAELVEWFFENHSEQDIYAVPVASNETVSRGGAVSYTQQISGLYGIFTNIVKDAYLSVRYSVSPADYQGMPVNLLNVNVNLQYTLIGGGSNGNGLVNLLFNMDGQFGPSLLEYRFQGMDAVVVDEFFGLPKIDAIVADPANAVVPKEHPARYAMITYVTHNVTDANASAVLQYVGRFTAEYQVLFLRGVNDLQPNMMQNAAFQSKIVEMSTLIM